MSVLRRLEKISQGMAFNETRESIMLRVDQDKERDMGTLIRDQMQERRDQLQAARVRAARVTTVMNTALSKRFPNVPFKFGVKADLDEEGDPTYQLLGLRTLRGGTEDVPAMAQLVRERRFIGDIRESDTQNTDGIRFTDAPVSEGCLVFMDCNSSTPIILRLDPPANLRQ